MTEFSISRNFEIAKFEKMLLVEKSSSRRDTYLVDYQINGEQHEPFSAEV
ncbi:hypothetical protein MIZ03_4357 [Rhodoferax lithotrophicus]|uniref:Uncharacterized protein n=1 Tax=Rhodoferax lithotrophicus TaxID=2798804 RepID=A0ABM7MT63_9BURK|nr:hypothetical protein MIZ03_4357 [Rhodoferax sp. MIZ03]